MNKAKDAVGTSLSRKKKEKSASFIIPTINCYPRKKKERKRGDLKPNTLDCFVIKYKIHKVLCPT